MDTPTPPHDRVICHRPLLLKVKGLQGEDRVVITFNGKFLPHIEQTKEGASAGEPKT